MTTVPDIPPRFRWLHRLACIVGVLALTVCGQAAEPKFTAILDRDTIGMGETATLSLTFEGIHPQGSPQLPPIQNLRVEGGVNFSQSSHIDVNSGQSTSSITFRYTLVPTREGEINIPAFNITLGGKQLASQALKLKVLKSGDSPPDESGAGKAAFVRLVVPKAEYYLGEVFPVEFQLFFQDAQDIQQPALRTDGFTIVKQPPHTVAKAQANGMMYNVVTFKLSLVAAKTGPVKLGPFESKLSLQIVKRGPGPRDPFEAFGFLGRRVDLKPVTLVSEAPVLNILPLPTNNVPPGFTGSVGTFAIQVQAGPTNVAVGDPITLRVRIEGKGTLDSIALPSLDDWREFKAYPPTSKVESNDPLGITGAKTFEVVVTPQNTEVKELPPLAFSYFDPELKSYRTIAQPAVKLTVRPSAPQQQPTVLAGGGTETAPQTRDIVHIKLRAGALGMISPPLVQQSWFLGVQAVPLLAWMAAFVWRKRQDNLANNPRLRRQLAVRETVRAGLAQLSHLAAANQAQEFYSTVFRLLQEQLGERLDQPASAITEEALENLAALGADAALVQSLHELFQQCNEARYAPASTPQQLAGVTTQADAALKGVQQLGAGGAR